jgi:hypothetical protein
MLFLIVLENKTGLHDATLVHFLSIFRKKLCVLQFGKKVQGHNLKFHLTLYQMQDTKRGLTFNIACKR